VQQLMFVDEHHVDQLLHLRVPYHGVGEDLVHEVDGLLDLQGMPGLPPPPFQDEHHADHLHGGRDVEHQRLVGVVGDQDRRLGEEGLLVVEGVLHLVCSSELRLLQQPVQRHPSLPELRDEPAQGG
jgi:hypothetical protein